jgi:multiple sugar transport system substrate-binding protein
MGRHSGRFDLYVYDLPWVGDYASRGWLIPLDPRLRPAQQADLESDADAASDRSYLWDGHLWALPIDAACHVTVFRPDLIGGAQLPNDWDLFLDYAASIHHPPKQYAFCVPWSAGSGNAVLSFIALLAAASDPPFADQTRLTIDPAIGRRALEIMARIWNMSLPPDRWRGRRGYDVLLDEDSAAIALSFFAYINYVGRGGSRRLAVADCPIVPETGRKASMLGGMGLGISVDCPLPEVAWDYAWYVMSREVQGGIYLEHEGQPGRISALSNPAIDARTDSFCSVLKQALANCYTRPRYPGWLTIENGAAPALGRYLAGDDTAEERGR